MNHKLQIYANLATGVYLVRAWGKTMHSGELGSARDLKALCADHFGSRAACAGHLDVPEIGPKVPGLIRLNFPFPRWISESCSATFARRGTVKRFLAFMTKSAL